MSAITDDENHAFNKLFEADAVDDVDPIIRPFEFDEWKSSTLSTLRANARRNGWTTEQYRVACYSARLVTMQLFDSLHRN